VRFLALAVCLGGTLARADVRGGLTPELRVGAGYDDNLFLDAHPTGTLPSQVYSDFIFDVEPRLDARLGLGRHALTLGADFLERVTPSNGDLRDLTLRLEYRAPPIGPVTLYAAALYEYYGASAFPEDTFHLGGGEAGLRVDAGERARLTLVYRGDARVWTDPLRFAQLGFEQRDVEQRALAWLHLRAHAAVALDFGYTFLHLAANDPRASLDRHRVDVALTVRPTRWLVGVVGYGIAYQQLPSGVIDATSAPGAREDLLQSLDVTLVARPLRWLEIFARYSLLYSMSAAAAGNYQRDQAIAGVSVLYELERAWSRSHRAEPEVRGARVTFHYRGHAQRVSVVGDWNAWDADAQPLANVRGDEFAGSYVLPPGRHEYALSVDGAATRPPDAPAYRADGFGGENGVLDVPY